MINVLEFADVINKADFIDTIIQNANPDEFRVDVCVRTEEHNIAPPKFPERSRYMLLPGNSRRDAIQTARRLSRLLKDWEIDILHAHHFEQAIVGWIATRLHNKTKLVIGRHYSDSMYRNPSYVKRNGLITIEQIINRAAKRIIVPSKMIYDLLTERQGVSGKKVDIINYGFDPAKYSAVDGKATDPVRKEFDMAGKFVFGNFSRLHEEKGHRFLIEAASILRSDVDARFSVLIVGEGPERPSLERQITEAGLGDIVKLIGWRKDAMAIMSATNAVVQSTLQEAFSQVMCEAMWLSKPLIMTEVSGASDLIEPGQTGLIVHKADARALANAMKSVMQNEERWNQIGVQSKRMITERLTIDKIIGSYEDSFRLTMTN